MSTELTYWHKFAQFFQNGELALHEIAKVWVINTATGIIEDEPDMLKFGINVLDNSHINNALVFGILKHHPEGELISYPEIGRMLNLHPNTVGGAVKRLVADGFISKQDYGASGSIYEIRQLPHYPKWIFNFTGAIAELEHNTELRIQAVEACKSIHFKRAMEVLKEELRKKFYHRKKPN